MQDITRSEIAAALGINIEDVAIRRAASFSSHIAINGTAYCGRLNNDGYNIATEFEVFTDTRGCGTCAKRYAAKVGA